MSQQNRKKNNLGRRGLARRGLCLLILLALVGQLLCVPSYAAAGGSSVFDGNTFALVVTTGITTAAGDLSEDIQYFKIVYEDMDGYTRSHLVFPGEDSAQESLELAHSSELTSITSADPLTSDEQRLMALIQMKSGRWLEDLKRLVQKLYPEDYQQITAQLYGDLSSAYGWYRAAEAQILPKLDRKKDLYEYAGKKSSPQALNNTRREYARQLGYPVKDIEDQKPFEAYRSFPHHDFRYRQHL